MAPLDSGDQAEGSSADESESGAREIDGGERRPLPRRGRVRGALFSKKLSGTHSALRDGVPVPGAKVSGRFRIDKLLAKGGMGTVWVGVDTELDRPVAVKFMDPSFAQKEDLRSRFTREAKSAAKLRTKHVVEVHEYGLDGTTPFIVMELLEGEDLHTHLKRVKRVSLETAASIVVQCCRALKVAADANIVHRDLKPGNVFLSRDLDEIVVKILDFGVAKLIDADTEVTRAGTMLGSPQYMSPEQAVGDPVDNRSDLWALAAIIFRMLTGKIAFSGKSAGEIILKLCTAPLPVPSEANPDLPKSIDRFFEKAFERNADKRFQTASELSATFVAAVAAGSADEPLAFASLANYPDLPSGRGALGSEGDFGSFPGTPVSGILSPLHDSASGTGQHAALNADELLNAPPHQSEPPESEPTTGVTRAADLERAEANAESPDEDDEPDAPAEEGSGEAAPQRADAVVASRPSLGISELELTQQRGLPPVVWVLFVGAIAFGAFLAFFFQNKPETGSLLDNLNLKPPPSALSAEPEPSASSVIDPLTITPAPSPEPTVSSSAAPSASASAAPAPNAPAPDVQPGLQPVWPNPNPKPKPKPPLVEDPYGG